MTLLPDTDRSIDEFADACEQGSWGQGNKNKKNKIVSSAFFKSLRNDREFCTKSGKKVVLDRVS